MIRIDVHLFDDAAQSQLNDTPIIPGCAPPAGLPSIHPFAAIGVFVRKENSAAGLEEILLFREKLIVGEQRGSADPRRGQVNQTRRASMSQLRSRGLVACSANSRDKCCRPMG